MIIAIVTSCPAIIELDPLASSLWDGLQESTLLRLVTLNHGLTLIIIVLLVRSLKSVESTLLAAHYI